MQQFKAKEFTVGGDRIQVRSMHIELCGTHLEVKFGKWCHEGAGVKLLRAGFVRVLARTHELRKQGSFQRTELRSLLYI